MIVHAYVITQIVDDDDLKVQRWDGDDDDGDDDDDDDDDDLNKQR